LNTTGDNNVAFGYEALYSNTETFVAGISGLIAEQVSQCAEGRVHDRAPDEMRGHYLNCI
jgi:hypothetical protein